MENLQEKSNLLDGIEPDAFILPSDLELFTRKEVAGTAYSVSVSTPDEQSEEMYRKSKVESLLAECRKQARKEAFLEAKELTDYFSDYSITARNISTELRRMAEGKE